MSSDRRRGRTHDQGGPYCSNCAETLERSMNYCPSCGRPNGAETSIPGSKGGTVDAPSSSSRPNTAAPRPSLERRITTAVADGWELEHDFGNRVVMVRRSVGGVKDHLVVAALTSWWTMGLGNALYGAYRYVGDAERMVLREDHADLEPETSGSRWKTTSRLVAVGCLTTGLALATLAVVSSAPVLGALAVGFVTVGLGVLPSIRRRLDERQSVTTNGYARSVDERSIVAYDRPCAACADPVGRGLERTYRKGFYVLGVPLTSSEGRNYYCRRCANAEPVRPTTAERQQVASEDVHRR